MKGVSGIIDSIDRNRGRVSSFLKAGKEKSESAKPSFRTKSVLGKEGQLVLRELREISQN